MRRRISHASRRVPSYDGSRRRACYGALMKPFRLICCLIVLSWLSACASLGAKEHVMEDVNPDQVAVSTHRGADDLLSAGLGLAGLAGPPLAYVDPLAPTSAELRQRAIQTSWKGIADLGPLGGYGRIYGAVPSVPGREYQAFARLDDSHSPHRVLVQVPDSFDAVRRCLLVAPASGSRGIYGAIALAGAWGLPRGCAVAYTDKGAGSGYFDYADDSGVALDGRRARRGTTTLEFEPPAAPMTSGIAVKHAHSGDNPEAQWGRHVLQAARFGLAMLDRAYPAQAPFTAQNTRVIAAGLSNGGGAVLQAAGIDESNLLAGVVAVEPNIHVAGYGRALYDYASEAALWMPCALVDTAFDGTPFARLPDGQQLPGAEPRCASLADRGELTGNNLKARSRAAYDHLRNAGWTQAALDSAAATTAFDVWRAVTAGYASAYLRRGPLDMSCGFGYAWSGAQGQPGSPQPAVRASWWADVSGIPPGNGVALVGGTGGAVDPPLQGVDCLRALWTADDPAAQALRESVAATAAQLPRAGLPVWVVQGAADGLVPAAFSAAPYVAWLRSAGRQPLYWEVPHAQHFDAFLALPGFGERHVPLLPYGYAALDRLWAHLYENAAWPTEVATPAAQPRGAGTLERGMLGLP